VEIAVGRVVELIGEPCAAGIGGVQRLGMRTGLMGVVVGVFVRYGRHKAHFGAGDAQGVDLFPALRLWHEDDGAIAKAGAQQAQADAGIASGTFDNGAAGADLPALYRILQQAQRGSILDRAAGVHQLRFGKHLAAGEQRGMAQTQQGRVANGGGKVGFTAHAVT
jgi:hypothetical protein